MLPYIKIDSYLFVYVQFTYSFYQEFVVHLFYLVLYLLYLRFLTLDYFVK